MLDANQTRPKVDVDQLVTRVQVLEQENRWLKQQLFGRSSEKRESRPPANQPWLFNEAEALSGADEPTRSITIPAHSRAARGRKAIPADLPRVDIVYDLADDEKICPKDGAPLKCIGDERSEQLDYIPAKVQVLRHIRLKYACPCCSAHMAVAEKPPQLLPRSNAAPSLLAHIACAKYVDGLPLNRQEKQFHRLGLDLPRATTANWMIKLGAAVIPIVNLLNDHLLECPVIHCDETTLQVLRSDKGPSSDHFMWVRAGGTADQKILLFDYAPSRSAEVARGLLADFRGTLLSDGYQAYDVVASAQGLVHAGCLAHYPESAFMWSVRSLGRARSKITPHLTRHKIRWIRGIAGKRASPAWASTVFRNWAQYRRGSKRHPWRRASSEDWSRYIARSSQLRHARDSRVLR